MDGVQRFDPAIPNHFLGGAKQRRANGNQFPSIAICSEPRIANRKRSITQFPGHASAC